MLALGDGDVVGVFALHRHLVGLVEDFEVRLEDLLGHRLRHELFDPLALDAGERAGHADTGGVAHDLAAVLAGERAQVELVDVPVVLLDALVEVLHHGGVDESLVDDHHAALAEFVEVLVQRLLLLVAVVRTFGRVTGERVPQCQEEVVAVAARLDRVRRRADLRVRVAATDARRVVSMCEYVQPRSHQSLGEVLARRGDPVTGSPCDSPDEFVVSHVVVTAPWALGNVLARYRLKTLLCIDKER